MKKEEPSDTEQAQGGRRNDPPIYGMAGQLAAGATARRYNGALREMGRDPGDGEPGRGWQGQAALLEAYQNPPDTSPRMPGSASLRSPNMDRRF
jgi:hypothetical protein